MDARERAERALRNAPIMPGAKECVAAFVEAEINEAVADLRAERDALREAGDRVIPELANLASMIDPDLVHGLMDEWYISKRAALAASADDEANDDNKN